ncbi:hypothetical protein PERCYII40_1741 [Pseudomonas aeruginosa]|nr:hypothetical protein PERCYII40_1741 [Pseudomonas aeruginosa]
MPFRRRGWLGYPCAPSAGAMGALGGRRPTDIVLSHIHILDKHYPDNSFCGYFGNR